MHIYGIQKDGNDNPICKIEKETQMDRTDFWTVGEGEGGVFQENRIETYIFQIDPLSIASFAIIFSHSEGCLFTLLIVWYIYTMEYYSVIKKNSFELVLMRWMKLEPIIQSEVSQKDKDHTVY